MPEPLLARLLLALHEAGASYILGGGQAVRLNGFVRATDDIDLIVPMDAANGQKIIRALLQLTPEAGALEPAWFAPEAHGEEIPNIRLSDGALVVDLLFAPNGESYETLQTDCATVDLGGIPCRVLTINGLLRTKGDVREKDRLDKSVLLRLRERLQAEEKPDSPH